MAIYAVKYEYDPRKAEALAQHRPEHRVFLRTLFESGDLLASGPLGENGALIVVRAADPNGALEMLKNDPLQLNEVILHRSVAEWTPVNGPWEL